MRRRPTPTTPDGLTRILRGSTLDTNEGAAPRGTALFQSVERRRSAGGRHRTPKHVAQNIDMIEAPFVGVFSHGLRLLGCKIVLLDLSIRRHRAEKATIVAEVERLHWRIWNC